MTIRQVTPADGSVTLTFAWDGGEQILTAGEVLAVDPGSALETAIGAGNLSPLTPVELNNNANGGGGWVTN